MQTKHFSVKLAVFLFVLSIAVAWTGQDSPNRYWQLGFLMILIVTLVMPTSSATA